MELWAWYFLGCITAASGHWQKDSTLDRHWEIWKEKYGKEYQKEVRALCSVTLPTVQLELTYSYLKRAFKVRELIKE